MAAPLSCSTATAAAAQHVGVILVEEPSDLCLRLIAGPTTREISGSEVR